MGVYIYMLPCLCILRVCVMMFFVSFTTQHVCMYICVCARQYLSTHMYAHTHTHVHVQRCRRV